MGYDVSGRLVDAFIAIVIMIFVPLAWFGGCFMILRQEYGQKLTEEFVEDVCRLGCISQERYEAYTYHLSLFGKMPDIKLSRSVNVTEPVYENEFFTGQVINYRTDAYTEQILSLMAALGEYDLNRGDIFRVECSNGKGTFAAVAVGAVDGKKPSD